MIKKVNLLVLLGVLVAVISARKTGPVQTYVTALYDIGRGNVANQKRSFAYYLDNFKIVLDTPHNLIVYGDKSLKAFVDEHRKWLNTVFVEQPIESLRSKWFGAPVN